MTYNIDKSKLNPKIEAALLVVLNEGGASISLLQRKLYIGFIEAKDIIEEMIEYGFLSKIDENKYIIQITKAEFDNLFK